MITKFFGDKYSYDVRRVLIERLISIELHHDDWQLLGDLHRVLKPFHFATRIMSVSKYPTAGLSYYTIRKIFNYLNKNESDDNARMKSFKMMLSSQFGFYFCSDEEQLNLFKVRTQVELSSFKE